MAKAIIEVYAKTDLSNIKKYTDEYIEKVIDSSLEFYNIDSISAKEILKSKFKRIAEIIEKFDNMPELIIVIKKKIVHINNYTIEIAGIDHEYFQEIFRTIMEYLLEYKNYLYVTTIEVEDCGSATILSPFELEIE